MVVVGCERLWDRRLESLFILFISISIHHLAKLLFTGDCPVAVRLLLRMKQSNNDITRSDVKHLVHQNGSIVWLIVNFSLFLNVSIFGMLRNSGGKLFHNCEAW